jgi:hypothetical protein
VTYTCHVLTFNLEFEMDLDAPPAIIEKGKVLLYTKWENDAEPMSMQVDVAQPLPVVLQSL